MIRSMTMGESDPKRWGPMHLVEVACTCADIEHCTLERYIADVRVAYTTIQELRAASGEPETEETWHTR